MTRRTTSSSSSKAERAARKKAVASVEPLPVVGGDWSPIDNSVGYEICKQVNLPQLQAEIDALSSVDVTNSALSGPDDATQAVGPGNCLALWIAPNGVDAGAVAQAVADHVPQPNWGIPAFMQDFNDILQRLRDNPEVELSDADKDALIRGVALNFSVLMSPPGTTS